MSNYQESTTFHQGCKSLVRAEVPKIEPELSHQTWCSRRWQCKNVFSGHGHPLPWPCQKTNGACEKTGDTCFRRVSSQILCLKKAEHDLHPRLPALKTWIVDII